jgi:hypothetical protein
MPFSFRDGQTRRMSQEMDERSLKGCPSLSKPVRDIGVAPIEPAGVRDPSRPSVERLAHRLKTRAGRATYALRMQTVAPVLGIIKSVMGFASS